MRKTALIGASAVLALAGGGVAASQILNGVPNAVSTGGTLGGTASGGTAGTASTGNLLAGGYQQRAVALGADALENPQGIHKFYGYLDDNANGTADATDTHTEPDQNTYLVTSGNPGGPTSGYDYGRHFLFQGHENAANVNTATDSQAYWTRINLDVTDPAHRITLLTPETDAVTHVTGQTRVDGSSYDPFTGQLLYSQEGSGTTGGISSEALNWSTTAIPAQTTLYGSLGRGGYEGVQVDSQGSVYIVEDAGGSNVTDPGTGGGATFVKQPNSFVYKFVPTNPADLSAGKLYALQVSTGSPATPVTFHPGASGPTAAFDDAFGAGEQAIHNGNSQSAQWVLLHDTAVDGTTAFDANALAKTKSATPFKRPENGKFVPGTGFKQFVFAETGDTDNRGGTYTSKPGSGNPNVPAASVAAWGALVKITLPTLGANTGLTAQTVELGDVTHNSFDNVTFLDANTVLTTEDRGDTLHDQLDTLDSVWSFDLTKNLASINAGALRLEAQGRDSEAAPSGKEDNEPTGIHVSDGATTIAGLLGTIDPGAQAGVRVFLTQQHGFNTTYELEADGANSPAGPSGANGANGANGAAGAAGTNGKDGAAGPAGPAGPQGPAGPTSAASQSGGHVTITYAFDGPSKDRYARVRLNLPTTGKLDAKLTARRKGKVVSLGSSSRKITKKGTQTVKILVPKAYYALIKDGTLTSGRITLTFRPSNGTKGVESATVDLS